MEQIDLEFRIDLEVITLISFLGASVDPEKMSFNKGPEAVKRLHLLISQVKDKYSSYSKLSFLLIFYKSLEFDWDSYTTKQYKEAGEIFISRESNWQKAGHLRDIGFHVGET